MKSQKTLQSCIRVRYRALLLQLIRFLAEGASMLARVGIVDYSASTPGQYFEMVERRERCCPGIPQGQLPERLTGLGSRCLQEMLQDGIPIFCGDDAQLTRWRRGALAMTWNFNETAPDRHHGVRDVFVILGRNATNAAVYEEYLHVQENRARNWTPNRSLREVLREEIRVEFHVLSQADVLQMTLDEIIDLQDVREGYLEELYVRYRELAPPEYAHHPPLPSDFGFVITTQDQEDW